MGQAALVFLIGTLIGLGGVAEDPQAQLEDPIEVDTYTVEAADAQASATVDAERTGTPAASVSADGASVDAGAAQASVDASVAEQRLLQRVDAIAADLPRLAPELGVTTVTLEERSEEPTSHQAGHVGLQGAQVTPDPQPTPDATAIQLAPAAAMVALAAVHVEPSLRGWRRLIPLSPLAPMYSRISRGEVLDHDTRQAIYDLLKDKPGLSLQEMTEQLELSRSTARHHIDVLEDNEMVAHSTRGRCRIHYPVGRRDEAIRRHVLANENRARITRAVREDGRTLTELAEELDENASAVHFHLQKLLEAGVVERRENGSVTYRAAEAIREGVTFEPVGQ